MEFEWRNPERLVYYINIQYNPPTSPHSSETVRSTQIEIDIFGFRIVPIIRRKKKSMHKKTGSETKYYIAKPILYGHQIDSSYQSVDELFLGRIALICFECGDALDSDASFLGNW